MRYAIVVLLVLAGCGGDELGGNVNDGGTSDGGGTNDGDIPGCSIEFNPFEPEASAVNPVRAVYGASFIAGVASFTWQVEHDGALVSYTSANAAGSAIDFIAATPGPYQVTVTVVDATTPCPYVSENVNVGAPGANNVIYRLRATPPASTGAPAQEQLIEVKGGASAVRDITLDPGLTASGIVHSATPTGPAVAAYLKFMPVGTPLAFTELFTGASGSFATHLLGVTHDVLVIPSDGTLAPVLRQWLPGQTTFVVTGGTVVTGVVHGPSGAALPGARVQLTAAGVPSTLGITAANGSFSLRADYPPSAAITVEVTPPATSGLPRLSAQGAFDLSQGMQIDYAASLATCDLAGTFVKRGSVSQANAAVTVVGDLAGTAGTVIAGVTRLASGSVLVSATANGSGQLPATLVPRASGLTAVTKISATDYAVDALDTSACSGLQIDAPALTTVAGTVSASLPLAGVRVEATPVGVLALAGAVPLSAMTSASGAYSIGLAPGAHYDVRFIDPSARAARTEQIDVMPAAIVANVTMAPALRISGHVSLQNSSQSLAGTAIQLLCAACTGVDATRPIAETATNAFSDYQIAVPDPGTM